MAPHTRARATRRTRLRIVVAAAAAACALGAYWVHAWWVSPGHRISQFAAASARGDYASMLALADAPEVRRSRLTPAKLGALLGRVSDTPGGIVYRLLGRERFNERQARFNYAVTARVERRVAGARMAGGRTAGPVSVWAYNTDRGWKVALTHVVYQTSRACGTNDNGGYKRICEELGVEPGLLEPSNAEWLPIRPRAANAP